VSPAARTVALLFVGLLTAGPAAAKGKKGKKKKGKKSQAKVLVHASATGNFGLFGHAESEPDEDNPDDSVSLAYGGGGAGFAHVGFRLGRSGLFLGPMARYEQVTYGAPIRTTDADGATTFDTLEYVLPTTTGGVSLQVGGRASHASVGFGYSWGQGSTTSRETNQTTTSAVRAPMVAFTVARGFVVAPRTSLNVGLEVQTRVIGFTAADPDALFPALGGERAQSLTWGPTIGLTTRL